MDEKNELSLETWWEQQKDFMHLLQEERSFPEFPVDLETKSGQKVIKDVAHDCMGELFEAVYLLKNSKNHRKTAISGFNREDFLEEIADTFHYLIEVCVLAGVSPQEMSRAYLEKGKKNFERIRNGY